MPVAAPNKSFQQRLNAILQDEPAESTGTGTGTGTSSFQQRLNAILSPTTPQQTPQAITPEPDYGAKSVIEDEPYEPSTDIFSEQYIRPEITEKPQGKPREYEGFFDEFTRSIVGAGYRTAGGISASIANVSQGAVWNPETFKNVSDKMYDLSNNPKYAPATAKGKKDKTFAFIAQSVGQALPYMGAVVLATITTGSPLGAFAVGASIEGEDAYREARKRGLSEDQANTIRLVHGTVAGFIEQWQASGILRFAKGKTTKGLTANITKKVLSKIKNKTVRKNTGRAIGLLKHSIAEATEEALQEESAILTPTIIAGAELPTAGEHIKRVGGAALGGAVAGGILGLGGRGIHRLIGGEVESQQTEKQPEPIEPIQKTIEEIVVEESRKLKTQEQLKQEYKPKKKAKPISRVFEKATKGLNVEKLPIVDKTGQKIVKAVPQPSPKPLTPVKPTRTAPKEQESVGAKPGPETKTEIKETIQEHKVEILPRKKQILKELDAAIQKAPSEKGLTGGQIKNLQKETLHFKINGGMDIYNTKEALGFVRGKVKSTKPTETRPIRTRPAVLRQTKAEKKELIDPLVFTEDKTIFTDGKLLMKGTPPKKAKFKTREITGKSALPKKVTDKILNTKTSPAEFSHYTLKSPGEVEAASTKPIAGKVSGLESVEPSVVFKVGDKYTHYDQWRYNIVRNRFPDARYGVADNGALIAYVKGKPVAVLMGIKINGKLFTSKPEVAYERPARKSDITKKAGKAVRKGFVNVQAIEAINRATLNILEPTKLTEKSTGKEAVATVLKAIHKPDVARLTFEQQPIDALDKTFGELREFFSRYSDKILEKVMLSRGHGLKGDARKFQVEAFASLPKELKDAKIRRALDMIADFNYKQLQKTVGNDINKMRDYFYGIYKQPKLVNNFLKYWKTTKRFTKQKVFPTYADAKAYGLEIRNPNPVNNLMAEHSAISHLKAMMWLKSELMRLGQGKFIAKTEKAPIEWRAIGEGLPIEPVFSDVRIQPDLANLINNLIAANKITQIKPLNSIRQANNVLRTIKFVGSAFHLLSIAKQSVADSGYLGFLYKKTALRGFTKGFKKNDPVFKTAEYKDYILHGGGHTYSVESESRRAFTNAVNTLNRNERAIIKAGGIPFKIPVRFVGWMFKSYIPKVKYAKYLDVIAEQEGKFKRQLTSPEKISIIKEQQNFYGMMNERLFGRSGTFTTILRFIFMAPGYAEGNYRTILKAISQKGAHRSRSNIVNSLLITGTLATVGTLLLTGKPPKKPEDLDDLRDLFKIDTGKKDPRGQRVMIDMLTYDRDYWDIYFNVLRLKPDKALSLSIRRLGGMRAPTADFMIDLLKLWRGEALIDWKGNKIYNLTDPFLLKIIKTAKMETQRLLPISASVFKQSRQRDVDSVTAAVEMVLGLRPTRTERDKREFEVVRTLWSLRDQREKLSYQIDKYDDPIAAIRVYNKTIRTIIDSKFVVNRAPDLIAKGTKLLIDEDKAKLWKRYPVEEMSVLEIESAIRASTYKRRYKRDGKWYPVGSPHKGKEDRVKMLAAEWKKRQTPFVKSFKKMTLRDAMDTYKGASKQEKREVAHSLLEKYNRVKNKTPETKQKMKALIDTELEQILRKQVKK